MIKVGAFDAKTHLSSLLDKVSRGAEVLITRRGRPIARLIPAERAERAGAESAIEELRALRTGLKLGNLDWADKGWAGRANHQPQSRLASHPQGYAGDYRAVRTQLMAHVAPGTPRGPELQAGV